MLHLALASLPALLLQVVPVAVVALRHMFVACVVVELADACFVELVVVAARRLRVVVVVVVKDLDEIELADVVDVDVVVAADELGVAPFPSVALFQQDYDLLHQVELYAAVKLPPEAPQAYLQVPRLASQQGLPVASLQSPLLPPKPEDANVHATYVHAHVHAYVASSVSSLLLSALYLSKSRRLRFPLPLHVSLVSVRFSADFVPYVSKLGRKDP